MIFYSKTLSNFQIYIEAIQYCLTALRPAPGESANNRRVA